MGILQQLLLIFSHTEFHQNLLNIMWCMGKLIYGLA
jgi:hypothetical protein